jgi:hypothetical protein
MKKRGEIEYGKPGRVRFLLPKRSPCPVFILCVTAAPRRVLPKRPIPGLDELGRSQAEAVGAKLAPRGPLAIVSSPLKRAQETSAPLAALWQRKPVIEPAVSEIPSPGHMNFAERAEWLRAYMTSGSWRGCDAGACAMARRGHCRACEPDRRYGGVLALHRDQCRGGRGARRRPRDGVSPGQLLGHGVRCRKTESCGSSSAAMKPKRR